MTKIDSGEMLEKLRSIAEWAFGCQQVNPNDAAQLNSTLCSIAEDLGFEYATTDCIEEEM